jgi:hypothetical protein
MDFVKTLGCDGSSPNPYHPIELGAARRIEVGGHVADDAIGHALLAKPIAGAPAIALQGGCEGGIEPDGDTGYSKLMRQIDRVGAIPPLIVGGVEDDGSIGLQMSAGAAFYFGKDGITIMRILKLGAHFIRSDDDRIDPMGVGLRPVAFARTGQSDENVEGGHE